MNEILKRYALVLMGLFINAFGVSFITKANLGTSPISSIPYTLSMKYSLTLGQFTLIFNLLLIAVQMVLMRKHKPLKYILEIPVTYIFSVFIDVTMQLLVNMNPSNYVMKVMSLLLGCAILALGVAIEFIANVVMLPGEAFVNAVCYIFEKDMGKSKVMFDVSLTIISVALCILFFARLISVREGTIISALLVGVLAKYFKKNLEFIEKYLSSVSLEY